MSLIDRLSTAIDRRELRRSLEALEQRYAKQRHADQNAGQEQPVNEDLSYTLTTILRRILPEDSQTLELVQKEPLRAIKQALAYLEHAPFEKAPETLPADFDASFAALLLRSTLIRIVVGVFVVVLFGGTTYLGFETAGALEKIHQRQSDALDSIGKQEERTLAAMKQVETRVGDAGTGALQRFQVGCSGIVTAVLEPSENIRERDLFKSESE